MTDRLSVFDLAEIAADVGPNPRTIGVLLELAGPPVAVDAVRQTIRAHLGLVPRLAQRVRPVPLGSGRPVWQDVPVDLAHHVRARSARAEDLMDVAAAILSEPLDPRRPWWTITLLDLPAQQRTALVWSSHHAMADGPSVLGALRALLGDGPGRVLPAPRPVPGRGQLTRDAWRARVGSVGGVSGWPQRLVGLAEVRASTVIRAPASPLNQPVTAGCVLRTVEVDLVALHAGGRSAGATVNDALLWAWSRAYGRRLEAIGLGGSPVVVACLVTVPSEVVRNRVGVVRIAVGVPSGSVAGDLAVLAAVTRQAKGRITGSSWWLLAQVSRALGSLGLYRRVADRQRWFATSLTNLRGPVESSPVLGRRVIRAVPVVALLGNVTAGAAALSYGGRLVVTVVCSPQSAHLIGALAGDLAVGLAAVAGEARDGGEAGDSDRRTHDYGNEGGARGGGGRDVE